MVTDRDQKRQRDRLRRANRAKKEWLEEALRRARGRGLEFDLVPEDFWSLPSHCPIFPTIELNYSMAPRTGATASLERIDNEKGYVRGQCHNCLMESKRSEEGCDHKRIAGAWQLL